MLSLSRGPNPKQILVRGLGPSFAGSGSYAGSADRIALGRWDADSRQRQLAGRSQSGVLDHIQWISAYERSGVRAIIATLNPGSYTLVVRGNHGGTGRAAGDLRDLSSSTPSRLTAVGTRAQVLPGGDLLSSGFVSQQSGSVLIRVLGPSLAAAGVANVLANPTLELRDSNGALLAANNDWQDDPKQASAIVASGLAPSNSFESALVVTLPPGVYSSLAAGINNGTGNAYLQLYGLPHSGPALELTP